MPRGTVQTSIHTRVKDKVERSPDGTVLTPALFASVGSRDAIDDALKRLAAQGVLRRLARGLYDKPRHDELLGPLWPSLDAVVEALVSKDRVRLQPTGAYAANALGLSDQVPARVEFLTDGVSRTIHVGPTEISLKHASPRAMAAANRLSGLVIQAFKSLGEEHITAPRLAQLKQRLPPEERATLLDDLDLAPGWMRPYLRQVAQDDSNTALTDRP